MNRWLALVISVAGGLALSFVLTTALFVGIGSLLWIFVLGDETWPEWVRSTLDAAIPVVGLLIALAAAWIIWTRLNARPEGGPA
jgi:hypothetical protein